MASRVESPETARNNLLPIHGSRHPSTATARLVLADALVQTGRADDAQAQLTASISVLDQHPEDKQQWGAYAWNVVARVALARGKYAEARSALDRAHAFTTTGNVDLYDEVATGALVSEVERRTGAIAKARAAAERTLALAQRSFVDGSPGLVPPLVALGEATLAARDPGAAVPPLERALALLAQAQVRARWLTNERFALARALVASGGDRKRAVELAAAARAALPADGKPDVPIATSHPRPGR